MDRLVFSEATQASGQRACVTAWVSQLACPVSQKLKPERDAIRQLLLELRTDLTPIMPWLYEHNALASDTTICDDA